MQQKLELLQQVQQNLSQGLYDPRFEHDACGIGMIAYVDGQPHPDVLPMALKALSNLAHRGAIAADGRTSDGAGILCQLPRPFFVEALKKEDISVPENSLLAVGQIFLPKQTPNTEASIQLIESVLNQPELGLNILGWRDVPVNPRILGPQAEATQPIIKQLFAIPADPETDQDTFERQLYLARGTIEKKALAQGEKGLYICSLSSRVIVYKGLLIGEDLGNFYTDLRSHEFQVGMATFHQRYSTNTFPAWKRAQPLRIICHNGEINTLQGNVNWMKARESTLASPLWGDNIDRLRPVIDETGSDSAMFDNVLELLTRSGRNLPHAMAMLVPEAWKMNPKTAEYQARRDFFNYHACLMEPWDGPAALVFCDGETAGITLDRNGLRPIRYQETNTGLILVGSEAGFIELDQSSIVRKGRLGPGQMLVLDTREQKLYYDKDIKAKLAEQEDYHTWVQNITPLPRHLSEPEDLAGGEATPETEARLDILRTVFGYTSEELTVVIRPMANLGKEPIGSMGDDTPVAMLSQVNRPVHHYLKQRFAQVTNPPIDPLREYACMSLQVMLGKRTNILHDGPEQARQLLLESPVLYDDDLKAIQTLPDTHFKSVTLDATFAATEPEMLRMGLKLLTGAASAAVHEGATILVISDKNVTPERAPIPILLAVGAVHHHLINEGLRAQVSLVVQSGEVRDVHHFATLIGYGAEAINPYLLMSSAVQQLAKLKKVDSATQAMANVAQSLEKGLYKIMSKMGISTVDSYCGAQIFEAIGLSKDVIETCLLDTPSKLGGVGLADLAAKTLIQHQQAFSEDGPRLPSPGFYKYKRNGEHHDYSPQTVRTLQKAIKTGKFEDYQKFVDLSHKNVSSKPKDGLNYHSDRQPIPLSEVEPIDEILRRFSTAAMSHGAISAEAHETLAIAMNRIGGMSNSGEGGEDPTRYGNERSSGVKQVASGRFGVTPPYLMDARELQIKMAQGSKPGEGGHLPGHKVSFEIASLRHSTPGVGLISPPPHHDIYSIEDLSQLIFDLKQINPMAAVSVKLVAESGVGTIAAGVVKGGADVVHLSGDSGGTGASPLSSIKHAGLPFEIGLAEAQQTLIGNDLRDRVRLRTDGGIKTGRDVIIAALLGADEFSFGTAALVAEGCIMARACHNNTCPVGIATQKAHLREKFPGKPEMVIAYMTFIAEEVRQILAEMGYSRLSDIIGQTELLEQTGAYPMDLSPLLYTPDESGFLPRQNQLPSNDIQTVTPLNWRLVEAARSAVRDGKQTRLHFKIKNTDRSVGATLSGVIAVKYGLEGLQPGTLQINFEGSAGQSFGVFNSAGMHLLLIGEANDYVGKGMAGGEIVIRPPKNSTLKTNENAILGNTALYGATGGQFFAAGMAGERFAVRNSGAVAVVEGVGHHACEYMTGGTVVVLGETGQNFGAGMSGGEAFVFDPADKLEMSLNPDMVEILPLDRAEDIAKVRRLLATHVDKTGSTYAQDLLNGWETVVSQFKKVEPIEKPKVLAEKMKGDYPDAVVANGKVNGKVQPEKEALAASKA